MTEAQAHADEDAPDNSPPGGPALPRPKLRELPRDLEDAIAREANEAAEHSEHRSVSRADHEFLDALLQRLTGASPDERSGLLSSGAYDDLARMHRVPSPIHAYNLQTRLPLYISRNFATRTEGTYVWDFLPGGGTRRRCIEKGVLGTIDADNQRCYNSLLRAMQLTDDGCHKLFRSDRVVPPAREKTESPALERLPLVNPPPRADTPRACHSVGPRIRGSDVFVFEEVAYLDMETFRQRVDNELRVAHQVCGQPDAEDTPDSEKLD